ncbi:hypothetical protein HYPSUDRAFT_206698 [Hypholoma sublateritium FD-334 SS-4]|uniref:Uncharacterized protein n=1 Tax=Hypholoma sublateritium (strain FD-334 SS-4) TaxID=945553 RepID=A0A0D2NCT2_HYPSF|nr:hypothetical protein HYPSUDRAFT_206698 [Hypholoma sublateritium FD-334 SS-4]
MAFKRTSNPLYEGMKSPQKMVHHPISCELVNIPLVQKAATTSLIQAQYVQDAASTTLDLVAAAKWTEDRNLTCLASNATAFIAEIWRSYTGASSPHLWPSRELRDIIIDTTIMLYSANRFVMDGIRTRRAKFYFSEWACGVPVVPTCSNTTRRARGPPDIYRAALMASSLEGRRVLLMGARLALSIDAATKELERIVGDHRDGDCVIADGTGMVLRKRSWISIRVQSTSLPHAHPTNARARTDGG